jgi:predicted ATPase
MNSLWRIEMFGGLRAVVNPVSGASTAVAARVVERFRTQKTAALLAFLAFHHKPHPREVLIEMLWPGCDLKAGSQNLRTALSSLRRQLEPPGIAAGAVLMASHALVQLHPQSVTTDVVEFESALRAAKAIPERARREIQIGHYESAATIYTGPFLPGIYDDWALTQAERLAEEYFEALGKIIGYHEAQRDYTRAFEWARAGVRVNPPDNVVRAFKRFARIVEPGLKIKIKHRPDRRARLKNKGACTTTLVEIIAPESSAEHTATPPAGSTPELRVASTAATPPLDRPPIFLPPQFTRFFGREAEIARLRAAFVETSTRLLTLTGAGGAGKTRLAVEAARALSLAPEAENWWHAAHFVALADVRESHLIASTIIEALALPRAGESLLSGTGAPETFPLERLIAALAARPTLLVLDNYEHLSQSAALLELLLSRVPHLRILVTSQHRLHVAGEREILVEALPLPQPDESFEQILTAPSTQLFVDRAQMARADFQITPANAPDIARLCMALEGSPLAIELAAARAGVLAPAQIALQLEAALASDCGNRLDYLRHPQRAATPRHASLRSAIAWSYQLLPPDLAKFWTQLAVFRGGFTQEAAQALAAAGGLAREGILHWLHQLRACSLLNTREQGGVMRFSWPELLREFASEQLEACAELDTATRRAHAEYFCDLLADGVLRLRTPDEPAALGEAAHEAENARAALDWAQRNEQHSLAVALALTLGTGLQRRGLHREALERVEAGLVSCESLPPEYDALRTALLRECAGLHLDLLQWSDARGAADAMRLLCARQNDEKGLADAINLLGLAAKGQNQWARARRAFDHAREKFEALHDTPGLANAHNNLGLIEYLNTRGNKVLAREHLGKALRLRWELSDARGVAETFINLGALAQQRGDYDEAGRYYSEALGIEARLRHIFGVGRALCNLGEIAEERGHEARAFRLYVAAKSLFEIAGVAYQKYSAERADHLESFPADTLSQRAQARRFAQQGALDELIAWAVSEEI